MSRTFILLYYPGSGSSWLMDMVGHAPGVWVPGFEPIERWHWDTSDRRRLRWLKVAMDRSNHLDHPSDRWLSEIRKAPNASEDLVSPIEVVGFKMTTDAVHDHGRLLDLMSDNDVKILVLLRENRLKHALSLYRSYEEKKNQFQFAGELAGTELDLDTYDGWLETALGWHERTLSFMASCESRLPDGAVAVERYEDMVTAEGKDAMLDRVCEFVGVPRGGIGGEGYFRKATSDKLSVAVTNFEEFEARFGQTIYARHLD